ncbi:MAG: ABC transporter permease [Candidatus Omnitrophota bacterium]
MTGRLAKIAHRVKKFDLIIFVLFSWEIFARFIYPRFEPRAAVYLPAFSSVLKECWQLLADGILIQHIWASLRRVLIGFSLASLCGITLGFIIGLSQKTYEQLHTLCQIFRPIPPVAWIPISLLWFGITEAQQYFIIFIGVLFPILFNTLQGVHSVSSQYKLVAQTLGARRFLLIRRVILPAVLPRIIFGLRSGLGYAWFIIVAAEFVSAPNGLGYLILEGRNMIVTERIFVGMIAIGAINLFFHYLLTRFENWLAPWRKIAFIF